MEAVVGKCIELRFFGEDVLGPTGRRAWECFFHCERRLSFFLFSFFPEKSTECDINIVLPAPTYRITQAFDVGQSPTATKD